MIERPIYQETQRWIANPVVVFVFGGVMAVLAVDQFLWRPVLSMAGFFVIISPLVAFLFLGMRVSVYPKHVEVTVLPFIWSHPIRFDHIRDLEAVRYRPFDYQTGIGYGEAKFEHGLCYSISGSKGVRLEVGSSHVMIGSRRPERLAASIQSAMSWANYACPSEHTFRRR